MIVPGSAGRFYRHYHSCFSLVRVLVVFFAFVRVNANFSRCWRDHLTQGLSWHRVLCYGGRLVVSTTETALNTT